MQGLNKVQEFLAGADLFRVRKQNGMAAFMLHQAAEQALHMLLRLGTGYYCHTHNIERLVKYAGMISCQVPEIFSTKTQQDKRTFALLQRAYYEPRYGQGFQITTDDLMLLTEKVSQLRQLLTGIACKIFKQS